MSDTITAKRIEAMYFARNMDVMVPVPYRTGLEAAEDSGYGRISKTAGQLEEDRQRYLVGKELLHDYDLHAMDRCTSYREAVGYIPQGNGAVGMVVERPTATRFYWLALWVTPKG